MNELGVHGGCGWTDGWRICIYADAICSGRPGLDGIGWTDGYSIHCTIGKANDSIRLTAVPVDFLAIVRY